MAKWIATIKIKDVLDTYDEADELASVPKVAQALIERLKTSIHIPASVRDPFAAVQTEAAFNRALTTLYDYADGHRIWLD